MDILLFGATGMIGQGVLREAKSGYPRPILETADINAALGAAATG